jgi:tight adherence protein B
MSVLVVVALVAICGGSAGYVAAFLLLTTAAQSQRKQAVLIRPGRPSVAKVGDIAKRRKAIADSLREIEGGKGKRLSLSQRLVQAGVSWGVAEFSIGVAILGALLGVIVYFVNGDLAVSAGVALVAMVATPTWGLSTLRKRRIKKFLLAFPPSIDVIIRGIKAGLPIGDCFRMIASEAPEPVRSEFRRIVEAQTVGLTIGQSVEKLAERMPIPETSFFSIVVNIQQSAGGNLSEALANLAEVLRDRKRMREKVKAISSEAKASAWIIGSLPFIVGGLVYLVNAPYILLLFNTTMGNIIIGASLLWMSIGVFIMRKMINFDI